MFRISTKKESPSSNIRLAYNLTEGPKLARKESVKVGSSEGIHSRPAAVFVRNAREFESEITVQCGEKTASGKSTIKLMSLGAKEGDALTISASGPDEDAAVEKLSSLFADEGDVSAVAFEEAGGSSVMDMIRETGVEESSFSRYLKGKI